MSVLKRWKTQLNKAASHCCVEHFHSFLLYAPKGWASCLKSCWMFSRKVWRTLPSGCFSFNFSSNTEMNHLWGGVQSEQPLTARLLPADVFIYVAGCLLGCSSATEPSNQPSSGVRFLTFNDFINLFQSRYSAVHTKETFTIMKKSFI